MHILEQLGVALGLATLAGVNLYLTVLIAGLAIRFDLLNLATQYHQLEVLGHPAVLIVAGILFCVEFFADKIPWLDSAWDSFHTFIRPIGGVVLGLTALGDVPVYVQVVAALVAGGAALTTHGAKAGTRLLVNHSPEPVSNVTLSVTEDVAVVGGTALALLSPVVGLVVFSIVLIIIWMVFPPLWRAIRSTGRLARRLFRSPSDGRLPTQPVVGEDLRNLLKSKAGVDAGEVLAAVPCLSGRCRGIRGLSPNLDGTLVLTSRDDGLFFTASKGLSDLVFHIPLPGARVLSESRFLSENLVIDVRGGRVAFCFPRTERALVQTLSQRIRGMIDTATRNAIPAQPAAPAPQPVSHPPAMPAPTMTPVPATG